MSQPLSVDIWSDVVCPWCYIGKRRFERALTQFQAEHPDTEVTVTFHSFELAPDAPADFDVPAIEYLMEQKGISKERVIEVFGQLKELAAAEGLDYHLESAHQFNTRKAHELLHFAKTKGLQSAAKEALMRAHFTENKSLGQVAELVDVAASIGLDPEEAKRALTDGTFAQAVLDDEKQAQSLGINAVPFFILDGKYGLSGAQPTEVMAQALEQVRTGDPSVA